MVVLAKADEPQIQSQAAQPVQGLCQTNQELVQTEDGSGAGCGIMHPELCTKTAHIMINPALPF